MLELRRLRLLHELHLRGTIAEVAAALAYSPSSVSQQLSLLEREAGVPLLEPDGRRLRLTAAGRLLVEHAARALELDEAARLALAADRGAEVRVQVAAMPTAAEALVPHALQLLEERAPWVRLEMTELPPERALFELAARSFDLVVAEQYPGHIRPLLQGLEHETLGFDPLRLAVASTDAATGIADLAGHAWVLEPRGTAVRQWAEQQCRAAGFEPDVRFEATDLTAHIRLVAAGRAVGVLPDLVWSGDRDGVRSIDLPDAPRREIFAASRVASSGSEAIALVRAALHDALVAHEPR